MIVSWCTVRGLVAVRRVLVTTGDTSNAYFIHFRRGPPRDARQRCEPPPASRGQGPGHSLRRPQGAAGAGARPAEPADHDRQRALLFLDRQLKIGEQTQEAIVKDVQMHPAQATSWCTSICSACVENEKIRIHAADPLQGRGGLAGREDAGRRRLAHAHADVEVSCLPKDLPEFLELDLSSMNLNETKFLSDMPLPPGVTIPELAQANAPVVSIHSAACRGAGADRRGGCGARRGAEARCWRLPLPAAARALRPRAAGGRCQEGRRQEGSRRPAKKEGGKK